MRSFQRLGAMVAVALLVFLTSYASIELTQQSGRIACVWFSNALLLCLVLKSPRALWPGWLVSGLIGNIAADVASGDTLGLAVPLSLCNTVEVLVAGWLYRLASASEEIDLTRSSSLLRFILLCAGIAPALAGALAGLTLHLQQQADFWRVFFTWTLADTLGFLIIVPLFTSTRRQDFAPLLAWPRILETGAFGLLVPALTAPFLWLHDPAWLFLVYPVFVLGAVRQGFAGAAAVILLTTATGLLSIFVSANQVEVAGLIRREILELQGLIVSCVLTSLPVSSLLAEVKKSESRVREFFGRHYVPMWFLRADDGLILDANQAAIEFYGYGPSLVGMHTWDINQAGKDTYLKDAAGIRKEGRAQWVFSHRLANGEIRQVQVSSSAVVVGGEALLLSILVDMTDRLRAEEALLIRTEELDTFFATCLSLLCIADVSGQILRLNAAWEGVLGYPLDYWIGKPFLDYIHPDDRAATVTAMSRLAEGQSVIGLSNRYRHRNGSWRWLQWESAPKHGLIYAAARDVTAEVEAKAELSQQKLRYESLMSISQDAIHLLDQEGNLVEANPAFLASLGYTLEQAQGLKVRDWDAQFPQGEMAAIVKEIMQTPRRFETRHRRSDGNEFEVEVSAAGVDLDGSRYLLAASRDISERKEMLDTLEQRVDQEVSKNLENERILMHQSRLAAMGEMLAAIAHQWRQPLNALNLILANLQDASSLGPLSKADLDQSVAKANQLIQKMSSTISDFRDFYRPNRETECFSVKQQVQQAISLVEAVFDFHHILIEVETTADLELVGFPQDFSQVLLNLLNNAQEAILAKATGLQGKVLVMIGQQGHECHVSVRDNGGGMETSTMGRIFDPYYTTRPAGTGLGLYLSKIIVERKMNGRLQAQNVPGGAEFSIFVPLSET